MVQARGRSDSSSQRVDDEEDQKPVGRPGRSFRGQVVAYIENFVRTGEQLASLAALLGRNEDTLRRWVQEDATSSLVIPPASDDAMVFGGLLMHPETFPGGVLGDILHKVMEQQSAFIVQTLRDKSSVMTLGELQSVLNSKLGRLVADVRVKDIQFIPPDMFSLSETIKEFQAKKQARRAAEADKSKVEQTPPRPPALDCTAAVVLPIPMSAPGPAPASASEPASTSTSGTASPHSAVPQLESRVEMIVHFLREHPGWHRSGVVRRHAACEQLEFREAVKRLQEESMIIRRGVGRATEYSLRVESAIVVQEVETTAAATATPTPATPAAPTHEVMIKEVLKVLYEARRPLTPAEIRMAAHCTPSQFHKAIGFLRNAGEVMMIGKVPRPAYQVVAVAQDRKTSEIEASEQVFRALADTSGTGGTMTVVEIRSVTRLTDEQVRRALHDLLATGRIHREGNNATRRYGLATVIQAK